MQKAVGFSSTILKMYHEESTSTASQKSHKINKVPLLLQNLEMAACDWSLVSIPAFSLLDYVISYYFNFGCCVPFYWLRTKVQV